jgi:branched-chain amino acid transport system permease protein
MAADRRWSIAGAVFGAACLALVLVAPFVTGRYTLRVLTSTLMFAGLAVSWNIIGGLAGYFSFGHAVFFGIGAYAVAIGMVKFGLSFWTGLVLAGVCAALFAITIGLPVLRLKGHYFALVTLGIGEVVRGVVANLTKLTGGGGGLSLPIFPGGVDVIYRTFYFLMLGALLLSLATVWGILRSRFGYGLLAIREDEDAAKMIGIPATAYKVAAFALSALFFGIYGGIYAYWLTYVEPPDVFDIKISVLTLIMALLGGRGTFVGPLIGAIGFQILSEFLWNRLLEFHTAFLGALMIVIVLFFPRGFMDVINAGARAAFRRTLANVRVYAE